MRLVKSFCVPLLTYCIGALCISDHHVKDLAVRLNDAFRRLFGYKRYKSVNFVQNLNQIGVAVSEEMRTKQTDGQTDTYTHKQQTELCSITMGEDNNYRYESEALRDYHSKVNASTFTMAIKM